MSALIPDPTCDVIVKEVMWSDAYPEIVPRKGSEPGIIVDPSRIADGHTLLLATGMMTAPDRDPETVVVMYLIEGAPPPPAATPAAVSSGVGFLQQKPTCRGCLGD